MKELHSNRLGLITAALLVAGLAGCCGGAPEGGASGEISPQTMADALHAIMEADRTVYSQHVVDRLQDKEQVITASEHWLEERVLPLPAQMFRMGAELVAERTDAFTYALLSNWPINPDNAPNTRMEEEGLNAVAEDPSKPFYGTEMHGDKEYFTAVYADVAVAHSCITCHNNHVNSPKTDFQLGDVMGGIVIHFPLE